MAPNCPSDLCTGCGICAAICPINELTMVINENGFYVPVAKHAHCPLNCGLCEKCCPGLAVQFNEMSKTYFGDAPKNLFLGFKASCYVGFGTNSELASNASSGSIVNTVLAYLFEQKVITGAIVTRMSSTNPLTPEVFVAKSKSDLISASGSKYCPVNLAEGIKYILEHGGRYAVVGLPCHIQGIRKAESLNKKLRERILLRIGLFCDHSVSFKGTAFLLERFGIKTSDVAKLIYRSRGWPGGMTIKLKNGTERFIPQRFYWYLVFKNFFINSRCTLCSDHTNELADISLGDAWGEKTGNTSRGKSIIISRSSFAEKILQELQKNSEVVLEPVNDNKILNSQLKSIAYKKRYLTARMEIMKLFGHPVPNYSQNFPKHRAISYLAASLTYLCVIFSSNDTFVKILRYTPFPLLKAYSIFFDAIIFG